jgi:adenosine deaminase
MYRKFKVPTALATDDAGVSRSDMTQEYMRAVRDQSLDYVSLKRMARDSIEHSFLPGKSLWENVAAARRGSICTSDRTDTAQVSAACQKFLSDNERAREQWKLEKEFVEFEARWK